MKRAIQNILIIARLTVMDLVRNRILRGLVILSVLLIASGRFFTYFTFGEELKIIMDIGLSAILLIGLISGVFGAAWTLYEDIESKTLHMTLSYPLSRKQIIIGKYAAILLVILLNMIFMSIIFFSMLYFKMSGVPVEFFDMSRQLVRAIVLMYAECAIAASLVLCLSVFFTPIVNVILFTGVFILGHIVVLFPRFAAKLNVLGYVIVRVFYTMIPGFHSFNVKEAVVLEKNVSWEYVQIVMLYGVLYILWMLSMAIFAFKRREIK